MTVYDLTFETPNIIKTGDILNCPYNGQSISIELPRGDYKLEVWGAEGGGSRLSENTASGPGGLGGYSKGVLELSSAIDAHLYVGGMESPLTLA